MKTMNRHSVSKFVLAAVLAVISTGDALADEAHHDHHKLAKDVDAFHAVLAPVWHARQGPERLPDACAKAGELGRLAGEIRSTDAAQLLASIASLKAACQGSQGKVEGALHDVHEAFHQLIDPKPAAVKR